MFKFASTQVCKCRPAGNARRAFSVRRMAMGRPWDKGGPVALAVPAAWGAPLVWVISDAWAEVEIFLWRNSHMPRKTRRVHAKMEKTVK